MNAVLETIVDPKANNLSQPVQDIKKKKSKEIITTIDIDKDVLKLIPPFDAHDSRMCMYEKDFGNNIDTDLNGRINIEIMNIDPERKNDIIKVLITLFKLLAGEYKNSDIAKDFYFGREGNGGYKDFKQQSYIFWQTQQMGEYRNLVNDRIGLKVQLDVMWISKFQDINITEIEDGENILQIETPIKYWLIVKPIYISYLNSIGIDNIVSKDVS